MGATLGLHSWVPNLSVDVRSNPGHDCFLRGVDFPKSGCQASRCFGLEIFFDGDRSGRLNVVLRARGMRIGTIHRVTQGSAREP